MRDARNWRNAAQIQRVCPSDACIWCARQRRTRRQRCKRPAECPALPAGSRAVFGEPTVGTSYYVSLPIWSAHRAATAEDGAIAWSHQLARDLHSQRLRKRWKRCCSASASDRQLRHQHAQRYCKGWERCCFASADSGGPAARAPDARPGIAPRDLRVQCSEGLPCGHFFLSSAPGSHGEPCDVRANLAACARSKYRALGRGARRRGLRLSRSRFPC
mmetsp:Transcript_2147/g.4294  ORF Transcript_2147/g.4294 Transcript_2147/m.4294 type:complete len:217 (+) Transcript_2147:121-771(+)